MEWEAHPIHSIVCFMKSLSLLTFIWVIWNSLWEPSCPNPCSVINVKYLVYVDGRSTICEQSLNAAIVVVNMHPNFWIVLLGWRMARIRAGQNVPYPETLRRMEVRSEVAQNPLSVSMLFTRIFALSSTRMVPPDLTSSRLPSIFEGMYFHC